MKQCAHWNGAGGFETMSQSLPVPSGVQARRCAGMQVRIHADVQMCRHRVVLTVDSGAVVQEGAPDTLPALPAPSVPGTAGILGTKLMP